MPEPKIKAKILSVGTYVPDAVLPNSRFESFLDTNDEWIVTRTGISERRMVNMPYAAPGDMTAAEMGCRAARVAMERAGVSAGEVGGIVVATFTPDNFFPSTACRMQADLGCAGAFAFDVSAACAGFVYALTVASNMIAAGQVETMLVVGSEVISKTLDWSDRGTCILFGDGAGVAVLKADTGGAGVVSCHLSSDGTMGDLLYLPSWGEERFLRMKGNEVFKHAVRMMSDASLKAVEQAGMSLDDIDLLVPHQANIRMIQAIAETLGLPEERVMTNISKYGNTSSASIPLALEEAWMNGRVKEGSRVLFVGAGGGFTVGSAVCVM
ncbi:MAG: ketoacyl-ACP synthase III [Chitinispirillales bacterium]|jgi:3-oxoacyl-[acyl-carrier-protein] synthase-3|nr:ketoacyl-ACP synthase III [Chitinispirillales bacterium]